MEKKWTTIIRFPLECSHCPLFNARMPPSPPHPHPRSSLISRRWSTCWRGTARCFQGALRVTPSHPLPSAPEKQSILEAMEHLLARYREMRPLFLADALPMKDEWKMRPYLGVLPLVFRALGGGEGRRGHMEQHRR